MASSNPDRLAERILIHAPFGRDSALISGVLQNGGICAEACSSVEELCATLPAGAGAILIAEEALRPQTVKALKLVLNDQPPWSDLPVFIMTRGGERYARGGERLRALESLGNITLLERPLRTETMISGFRMALRARRHQYEIREHLEREQRAGEALKESEARHRTLAEALPQLVWACSPDGNCDYLSRQWVAYTGIAESEQLGLKWLDLVMHPDDREQTYQAWMNAVADRAPYDLEYRLRRHDGVYRWFKTRAEPLRDASGNIQRWFGTCTDIEEEKRASEERRQLLAREREARRTAELLNRVGPLLAAELDAQELAQKVTDLATQLTGAQIGALFQNALDQEKKNFTLYALCGTPAEAFISCSLTPKTPLFGPTLGGAGVLRSADIRCDPRYGNNLRCRAMADGRLPVRSYLAAPLVSRSGEVLGGLFFGSAEPDSFSEQHEQLAEGIAAQAAIALDNARLFAQAQRAKEALERSNAELRRANEDLNQFAYSASHDLKEPLRMVTVYSQLLQRRYASMLDEEGAQFLAYAIQGAKRMELLIRDLLAYTQVIAGETAEASLVDSQHVFQQATENLKSIMEETHASVEVGALPVLFVQQVHLLQLFQNLMGNALKYRGQARPHLHLTAEQHDGMWKFCFKDNGIGIDPRYAQQVFGLFKRLHGPESGYEGTGLGLAICQKIVERYGGRIWVESAGPGKGCTFCFILPGASSD